MDEMGQEHFTLAGTFHIREGLTAVCCFNSYLKPGHWLKA